MLTRSIAIDTSEGLFAELIWQICCGEEEYREFFDLPLTMWIRHPLCISVAHKVHGKSMATGWPRHPSDISEREGSKNNILFETWTSNSAKQDMEKASCDALRDDIKTVKLARPELYNKAVDNTTVRSANVIFEGLTNDDIEQEAMYSTVEVIDDKAEGEGEEGEDDAAEVGEEDMEE